ncbi:Myosin-1 [Venturia nashicola]|uniref:Myosin-1 n=1 Tax=Venturia nashicola TaxID=86259 RepID=A0A4Z1NVF8_9PEZI|nr:Myosin-1 [Venturia nashicola]
MSILASIKALPPTTVHRIGSSQVLVDSSSVVKELIDNSIDARATSISIEISANTLDVVQVTDNGHGIIPEDRAMVCRRYTTSKISDFSDLVRLGGSSLGFRGEALHSLANLSGSLSVTTRVDGEIAAVKLMIARTGEVEGRETASHPVGTSVRAADFFNSLPVRKQTALKSATKTLTKIKRMLQAYALARPRIRFSLRVLKAKTATGNFIYAPKAGASSVQDAALKLFGNHCTSQCSWHVLQSHGFELQAFCPTPEATSAKISNLGQFLSVDSRPMSTTRGTMRQIINLFKEKLKKSNETFDSIKDPFLCLNIVCPTASYDPNIEPSKDDVLFDDSSKVSAAVSELFTAIYPAKMREQHEESVHPPETLVETLRRPEAVVPFQSPQRIPSPIAQAPPSRQLAATVEEDFDEDTVLDREEMCFLGQRIRSPAWRSNMYGCDEEDLELLANVDQRPLTRESTADPKEAAREINPWTIAKMNAPVRRQTANVGPVQESESVRHVNPPLTPTHHDIGCSQVTPASSWTAINRRQENMPNAPPVTTAQHSQIAAYGLPTPHASSSPAFGTLLEDIPESATRPRPNRPKANVHKPFVNPMKDSNWDFGPPSWLKKKPKPQDGRSKDIRDAFGGTASRRSLQETPLVTPGEPTEPSHDDMLHEFNARLDGSEAVPIAQSEVRCDANVAQPRAPDKIQIDGTRRILRARSRPKSGRIDTEIEQVDDDYRPPVTRRRTTEGGKRSKSSRLPLERVPENQHMHRLVFKTRVSLKDITDSLDRLNRVDVMGHSVPWDCDSEFTCRVGTFDEGINPNEFRVWDRKIKSSLKKRLRRLEEDGDEEEVLTCIGALSRLERVRKGMGIEVETET